MHAYLSNHDERKRIHFILALCSVPLAWALSWAVKSTGVDTWWFDAPAVWGIFELLCKGFSKYGWRIPLLRKVGLVKTPDFSGWWKGALRTSHDGGEALREIHMRVVQDFDRIQINWRGQKSGSRSVSATIIQEEGAGARLLYAYENEPDPLAPEVMVTHDGTCELELDVAGVGLRGHYYNGRGRQNHGAVTFTRHQ